ncbi:MAG: ferrous iron transport protein B [Flavobacteriales bacterium]|nr:ferrous iron transport protein B [Flavobacteriales bacterium]
MCVTLVGNPNCGKTSLFNALTGLNQKVGNFPGVTVEKKTGKFNLHSGTMVYITDLPGTYSLNPCSEDEKEAVNYIKSTSSKDIILVIADATQLKRSLLLCSQIIDLQKPVVLVLNMMDIIQKNNIHINIEGLSESLKIPVIPINARIGKGIENIKKVLENVSYTHKPFLDTEQAELFSNERIEKINSLVSKNVVSANQLRETIFTQKLDKILTHSIGGYLSFLCIMFLIFQAVFSFAQYPMEWIESGFIYLSNILNETIPNGAAKDLLLNGLLAGLSGVFVFIPQIAILFALIAILEDTGYMARISFIMDKLLRPFGLNGRSVVPLLSGTACAVPSIMSARTIGNLKDRLITIFVIPLVSCSARIPVYTLLISLCIPADSKVGIFNLQGVVMMGLYLLGFIAALLTSLLLKYIIKQKIKSYFIMEMPIYRPPRWSSVVMEMLNKVKIFVWEAGRIIVAISIVLWVLSSYAPPGKFKEIEEKHKNHNVSDNEINNLIASEKLEASYAGILGKSIEPLIKPLGFNWKIGIALVTSFAAREVFVGTMATLYSIGDAEKTTSIKNKMKLAKNNITGKEEYTLATCMSLLIFYAFAMQCMATLAVVKRETNSWKWPILQVIYMGLLAWFSAFLTYQFFV